jgi:hypothetical protein
MSQDSNWWEYWKKRMAEREILELKEEVADLERTVEILDDSEDSAEPEEDHEE